VAHTASAKRSRAPFSRRARTSSSSRATRTVAELQADARSGRSVKGFAGDVGDREVITSTIERIGTEEGGIDVLVNNAGIVIPGYFEELAIEDFEAVLRTDYLGSVYATKAALPFLLKHSESAVTFTSSLAGHKGIFGYSTYCPAKSAVIALAEVVNSELKDKGLQVTVLCPADTDTPGFKVEKEVRPRETDAAAGSGGLMTSAQTAEQFLEAFKKGRFMVNIGMMGKVFYHACGISPGFVDYFFDSAIKKERKKA
jgi:3-dehydrosphinganine reductase